MYGPGLSNFLYFRIYRMHHTAFRLVRIVAASRRERAENKMLRPRNWEQLRMSESDDVRRALRMRHAPRRRVVGVRQNLRWDIRADPGDAWMVRVSRRPRKTVTLFVVALQRLDRAVRPGEVRAQTEEARVHLSDHAVTLAEDGEAPALEGNVLRGAGLPADPPAAIREFDCEGGRAAVGRHLLQVVSICSRLPAVEPEPVQELITSCALAERGIGLGFYKIRCVLVWGRQADGCGPASRAFDFQLSG